MRHELGAELRVFTHPDLFFYDLNCQAEPCKDGLCPSQKGCLCGPHSWAWVRLIPLTDSSNSSWKSTTANQDAASLNRILCLISSLVKVKPFCGLIGQTLSRPRGEGGTWAGLGRSCIWWHHVGVLTPRKEAAAANRGFQLLNIYQCAICGTLVPPATSLVEPCILGQSAGWPLSPYNHGWSVSSLIITEPCTTFSSGKG